MGILIPLFWTSGDVFPGFHASSSACKCMEEKNGSAAMPAARRAAGVVPEMNLRNPLHVDSQNCYAKVDLHLNPY